MSQTSRERVTRCLRFEYPDRVPRDLWTLPWATNRFPETLETMRRRFPTDFGGPANVYLPSSRTRGERYDAGEFTDEWGCKFINIQAGVHGEVKEPVLPNIADWQSVLPPHETLPEDRIHARDTVNRSCAETDLFMKGACCPRPWERYQFLRGTAASMMDFMQPENGVEELLSLIHQFYLEEIEFWVTTDVDAIMFMDDWGAQQQLLIPPDIWRTYFKPLYRDYCDIAHAHGKFVFMHSDGYIAEIYEDIIEVGVDALNSQLFCMDIDDLARRARGKITFWGEIDRQHVLPSPEPEVGRQAVRKVADRLYDVSGGVIAQFELGPGCNPETAVAIFDEWTKIA
jgi:uroporphyrinogen decarboxylase